MLAKVIGDTAETAFRQSMIMSIGSLAIVFSNRTARLPAAKMAMKSPPQSRSKWTTLAAARAKLRVGAVEKAT